jgi:glycosyltransferase involved in cell wall biosynthesis
VTPRGSYLTPGSIGDDGPVPERSLDVVFAAERVWPPLGGAERACLEMATAIAAAGHRVRTLGLTRPEADGDTEIDLPAIGWRAIPQPDHGHAFWDWRARVARADGVGSGLAAAIAERRPDVIVTYDTAVPAVARVAGEAQIPLLAWLHGYETLCHWRFVVDSTCVPSSRCRRCPRTLALDPEERVARIAHADGHRAALQGATALVAPSRALAEAAQSVCGRRPEVIAPVSRGLEPIAGDPDGPVLAVSSLWTRDKGAELLAPIAERLASLGRRLVVQVGDGGHHVPPPPSLFAATNVEVRTAPAEIDELLPGVSVLLVPSQMPDPWPRVAFEGMSAGIPVLASDIGGLRESVPAALRVAPHDDPAAWGTALRELLDPRRWVEARAAGLAAAGEILNSSPAARFVAAVEAAAAA